MRYTTCILTTFAGVTLAIAGGDSDAVAINAVVKRTGAGNYFSHNALFLIGFGLDTTDADLKEVVTLTKGHRLVVELKNTEDVLKPTKITVAGLCELARAPGLEGLWLPSTTTSDDLRVLAKATKLRHLRADRSKVGNDGLDYLAELPALEELVLSETRITDDCWKTLARFPQIKRIYTGNKAVTGRGAVAMANPARLTELSLGSGATDEGLADVGRLKSLKMLDISYSGVTDSGLSSLAGLTELRELQLMSLKRLADGGGSHLAKLKTLEVVWFTFSKGVGDQTVRELAKLPKIRVLVLTETSVTDEGLQALEGAKTLERLSIGGTKTTAAGKLALQRALPKCRIDD